MFEHYIIIFLLAHILGDYYIQTEGMAQKKRRSVKALMVHCILYWLTFVVVSIPIFTKELLVYTLILGMGHTIIDIVKYRYTNKTKKITTEQIRLTYITDQFVHIVCIFIVAYIAAKGNPIKMVPFANDFFNTIGISEWRFLKYILLLFLIHKPVNITIKQLLLMYKPLEKTGDPYSLEVDSKKNTGGFIGTIERFIILLLLSMNQFSTIGLVLTAKSIARYDQIAHDKDFAEYYLLGTLMSTGLVIGIYRLFIW